jgi:alanyl-tRNA synthetase
VAGETAREYARLQEQILNETSKLLGVSHQDLPKTVSRFFEEWKIQQKIIEELEGEIIRLRTSGNSNEAIEVNGIRYVIMEVSGNSKQMMAMMSELTRDPEKPTLAVLGSREEGGKLIIALTENSLVSEKYNAVEILNNISKYINGGGGGKPSFAQGGGSNPDGIENALIEARKIIGLD